MKKIAAVIGSLAFCIVLAGGIAWANGDPKLLIKIATLAPKSSSLASVFEKSDQEIREVTNNEVGFRTYYGGIQGDEKEVIQKIQFKQLHGGAFTAAGLFRIVPEVHILSLPYLYRNYDEVEFIRTSLEPELTKLFMDKGYVAAAWGSTGFVYEFSNVPITSPEVAKRQKYWQWGDDPVQAAMYKALGVTPVSLSITDVMTSLSTRLIDAASATPGIAVAFRWYTKFKYMSEYPIGSVQGAILIRKEIWDKISPENQKLMKSFAQKYYNEYVTTMKRDDAKASELLKKAGIQVVRSTSSQEAFRNSIAKQVQNSLVGKVFSRELLDRVLAMLEEYRRNHPTAEVVKLK